MRAVIDSYGTPVVAAVAALVLVLGVVAVRLASPPVVTVTWETASEVDNFGFDIYRSLSEDGSFDRITETPLPGAGTTDEPQSYEYIDDTNDPAKGYYYYIESISIDGIRERFSPIMKAPAKRPRPTSAPGSRERSSASAVRAQRSFRPSDRKAELRRRSSSTRAAPGIDVSRSADHK